MVGTSGLDNYLSMGNKIWITFRITKKSTNTFFDNDGNIFLTERFLLVPNVDPVRFVRKKSEWRPSRDSCDPSPADHAPTVIILWLREAWKKYDTGSSTAINHCNAIKNAHVGSRHRRPTHRDTLLSEDIMKKTDLHPTHNSKHIYGPMKHKNASNHLQKIFFTSTRPTTTLADTFIQILKTNCHLQSLNLKTSVWK